MGRRSEGRVVGRSPEVPALGELDGEHWVFVWPPRRGADHDLMGPCPLESVELEVEISGLPEEPFGVEEVMEVATGTVREELRKPRIVAGSAFADGREAIASATKTGPAIPTAHQSNRGRTKGRNGAGRRGEFMDEDLPVCRS
jgi:hypothetical protein